MEAADSTANSSKVIVQCHDPSNLFDQLIPKLEPRLPLTKLHWKSPNRPLRSIDQLDVSFVRETSKSDSATSTRRHQIPGLRQTPFVKIFLLRCDEREAYKDTARKDVKQWLKSQGIAQDGKTLIKGQERHDASEYIILHVVLPGTSAAAQPKSSKHISTDATDSTDSVNSKSKWTGKSPSTIFDKLRADFSSSSKAPFERVAQVRIVDPNDKQPNALSPLDIEEQWKDFIEKLKTAILQSFDARVAQYEDDIRDRDGQRHLPGWNFCTFFILKEGLARGFENVGLIEDALSVYGELDAGLDTIIQEQISQEEPDPTSALLAFSSDLKPAIRSILDDVKSPRPDTTTDSELSLRKLIDLDRNNFPFDIEKRQYQQRILTNQVSALDFRIYIFTRQSHLLFRQARIVQPLNKTRISTSSIPKVQYDLNALASICETATSFISFASRALRRDLYAAWGGQEGLSEEESQTQHTVIGEIVASWKWSAVMQTLADCQVLVFFNDLLAEGRDETSINGAKSAPPLLPNGQANTNQALAMWTGELLVIVKDALREFLPPGSGETSSKLAVTGLRGVRSSSLTLALHSADSASRVLQMLTHHAYQFFNLAGRLNASHLMLHSLAENEFKAEKIDLATKWLENIPDLHSLQAKTATDRAILQLYAKCLKAQGRLEDFAKTLTNVLLSSASSPVARALPHYDKNSQDLLDELTGVSGKVPETHLPLSGFVNISGSSRSVSHDESKHGFGFSLDLALRFRAKVEVSDITLILAAVAPTQEPNEIALTGEGPVMLEATSSQIKFESEIVTEGWYNLKQLKVRIANLVFHHSFQAATDAMETPAHVFKPLPIMVYPHSKNPSINVRQCAMVDLDQPGSLSFQISSGGSMIDECLLRIRPASAGFRLDVQAARLDEASTWNLFEIIRQDDMNAIQMSGPSGNDSAIIEIPFSTEHQSASASVKIEAKFRIGDSTFNAYYRRSTLVNLPIGINVQDIFQKEKLFSRFTAAPATIIPLRLLSWKIEDNASFDIKSDGKPSEAIDVSPRMPASWIVEVIRRDAMQDVKGKMPLSVEYQTYDDLIMSNAEHQFRQDLLDSPVSFASELLTPHLLAHISTSWSEQDLEATALLHEFEISSYEQSNWDDTLRALGGEHKMQAEAWLRSWHVEHRWLSLSLTHVPTRTVKLSVEVPVPSVIISTKVTLRHTKQYIAVSEPIVATLTIAHSHHLQSSLEIMFEITSQADVWLVGGKKRGTFTAKQPETEFSVILIPQRTGHLLLPSVDIRCRRIDGEESQEVNFEVEHQSRAKSKLVVSGLQSSTIAMNSQSPGRHRIVDSRYRQEAS